jgi:hypothetical protein
MKKKTWIPFLFQADFEEKKREREKRKEEKMS